MLYSTEAILSQRVPPNLLLQICCIFQQVFCWYIRFLPYSIRFIAFQTRYSHSMLHTITVILRFVDFKLNKILEKLFSEQIHRPDGYYPTLVTCDHWVLSQLYVHGDRSSWRYFLQLVDIVHQLELEQCVPALLGRQLSYRLLATRMGDRSQKDGECFHFIVLFPYSRVKILHSML